ncbi:SixA phosphatase family protein [Fulvivirga lutea]|uniref:Histidine phosphatase family protein n=1 Tax=Fulvivirga lutea TaxID=2810512 RepID=A0A974WFR8_9BACT|nr:histidine phosphatase family protein [Fulvivirga lutea]QSE97426.1 histidine phosphatase family protein [Fulvivirga lutea]
MKTLYLVRHAKSSWDYPELTDFERPLNKRGERDSPEMGKRLRKKGILPDLLLSSPANRALTTCKNIAQEIGYPKKKIATDRSIYHAGENTLLKVVQNVSDEHQSLMLFGHNPGFTDFANELANTDIYNIPTCGVFACSFEVKKWSEISFGYGQLLFYDYPKNI